MRIRELYRSADFLLARIPPSLSLFGLRLALAVPFWRSGMTKWSGFLQLRPAQGLIFSDFRLHIFGQAIPFPYPAQVAFLTGVLELVLPALLVIGLLTRFSALGLLIMTGVIQLAMPSGWANFHLPWAAMALALITYGGGNISLDRLLSRRSV